LALGVNWRLRKTIDANNSREELMAPISAVSPGERKEKGVIYDMRGRWKIT